MNHNYWKHHKWMRSENRALDRLCEYQRIEPLFRHPRFHYRKKSVVPSFRYFVKQGKTIKEAYQLACQTQLTGLSGCAKINVDARTVWFFDQAAASDKGTVGGEG